MAFWASLAQEGDTDFEKSAEIVSAHTERVLSKIDIAMTAAEEIAHRKSATTIIKHAAIRSIINKVNAPQEMLWAAKSGSLEVDSFNFPTPILNLSSRPYFQLALSRPGNLILTPPEIGKTSGVPFLPMVRGNDESVMVAVINPGVLNAPPALLELHCCGCRSSGASCRYKPALLGLRRRLWQRPVRAGRFRPAGRNFERP